MKKVYLFLLWSLFFSARSQTTITASYTSTTVVFSTGLTYITFAIRNNNPFPVTLTGLTSLQANLYDNNVASLWYSASSLAGPPSVISPGWTQITTALQPITVSVIDQVTPFNCIGLVIPPSTTYRFALQGTKGTAVRNAVTPNIFSSGGVDLLVGDNVSTGGQVGYFGWQNLGNAGGAYFFDGSITFAPAGAFNDLQVLNITKPASVCSATSNSLLAQVCNKSPHPINFATNNTMVQFNVSGPIPQTANLFMTAGTLSPCGCISAAVGGINFSSPGTYTITATATATGMTDSDPANNSFTDSLTNYKPFIPVPVDSVCQYTNASTFSGFQAFNCQPRNRTYTLNTLVSSVMPVDGSNDATAGLFAQSALPGLPAGAIITGGKLQITNLNGQPTASFGNQARFNIYSPLIGPAAPFVPGQIGSPLNFALYNFDYSIQISASQLNAMYASIGAGGVFNIGYWESVDNVAGVSDLALNAQSLTTQAILTIDYTIPSEVKWYTSALGGTSFYTGPVMNPFSIPASGLSGTSITGNYSFYAACASDTLCRVPVTLKIKASPQVVQDSLSSCEMISSTGNGSFNLTTLNSSVSAANPLATVTYFQDLSLSLPITNPLSYVAGTSYVYSKVEQAGCYSSDTVYLQVFPKPDFGAASVNAFACIPDFVDAAQLIDPFSLVPPGTDTLYFEDALYSIPHLNPHWITTVDTVYILFETNSIPVCRDSAIAYVNVMPMNNYIVNQDTLLNFSVVGSVGCSGIQLSDGQLDTLHSVNDCARIASVLDWPDGTSLGNTLICEEIEAGVPFHNGQPYVNRHYSLSPATIDSATVCLYFLDDDLQQYNNAAFGSWPLLPTSSSPSYLNNLCFSRVSNGDLNTPGHIAEVIPHTAITSSYDPATTVWTFCFTTDSFGYFYLHAQNPFNIPLAVSDFQWQLQGIEEGVRIQWSCATEEKMAHYQIERSTDGIHFQVISPVIPAQSFQSGSQVNQASYVWMDDQPGYCQAQYRIRLTDIENTSWYSSVKTNKCIDNESINLFPNPVSDQIQFTVNTVEEGLMLLDIFDLTGRRIHSVLLNTSPGSQKGYVDCTQWETGWYSWKGQLPGGKTFSGKLLKKYN